MNRKYTRHGTVNLLGHNVAIVAEVALDTGKISYYLDGVTSVRISDTTLSKLQVSWDS